MCSLINPAAGGDWIILAKVVRSQGRKGEVLCDLLTDFPDQFASRPGVFTCMPNTLPVSATIENHWLPTGRSAGRVVLKMSGIDSISEAERCVGMKVQIPADDQLALQDGMFYVKDLVGCALFDGDVPIGTVVDLQFPQDASGRRVDSAAALFVVRRDGKESSEPVEVLVPFANAFIDSISLPEKRIAMRLPAGLLDLNG